MAELMAAVVTRLDERVEKSRHTEGRKMKGRELAQQVIHAVVDGCAGTDPPAQMHMQTP